VDHDLGTHYEHEHDMRRTTHLNTMVAHLNTMMAHPNPDFFVLTFFKIIYKINLWKTFFHQVTPLVAPAGVARQVAFVAPHASARQG
jgi:hypothetical protein